MDTILGRTQFLSSETANLFTDEKTANARAKVRPHEKDLTYLTVFHFLNLCRLFSHYSIIFIPWSVLC